MEMMHMHPCEFDMAFCHVKLKDVAFAFYWMATPDVEHGSSTFGHTRRSYLLEGLELPTKKNY